MKDRLFILLAATIVVGVFLAIFNPTPVLSDTAADTKTFSVTTTVNPAISHKG